jgi:hypothetical protein
MGLVTARHTAQAHGETRLAFQRPCGLWFPARFSLGAVPQWRIAEDDARLTLIKAEPPRRCSTGCRWPN